ncbi:MAG: hypothetical protein AUK36_07805 [Zetaproteobacteria bacterium CG2_30_59_37]|nr:MAG: hypothetical protein AUK36_07805 [Zetaproteobacteria bacterium CG2_30_59_37]
MFVGLRNVLLLSVCLIFAAGQAGAVALGKIEVTSHLGETFFAEAPLQLDSGEKISDVTVEMAAPSDYQILEVFRDPALNSLAVEVVNDLRGPRVVISSNQAVDTPYFNLVLKMRHGHATNFKKYPVFLDLPEQVRPAAPAPVEPQPAQVESVQQAPEVSAVDIRPIEPVAPVYEPAPAAYAETDQRAPIEPTGSEFNPYDGWARTSRYGPMVRGDTITTVARRLRVDERYTINQIMVGLFNKNKDKFREGNINLINAGTYLNVPSAAEVESVPASEAEALIKQQEKQWKNLRNQPVYAAEAEAQENRYRARVNIGQSASGTAAAPMPQDNMPAQAGADMMGNQPVQQGDASAQAMADQMRALQEENLRLQQALKESEASAAAAPPATADSAAADERVKKLELTVARLQRQLVLVNQELETAKSQDMNALTYVMGGIILLLIAVAGYLLFLLRRDRPHASMQETSAASDVMPAVAAMAAPVAAAMTDEIDSNEAALNGMDAESIAASLDSEPVQEADIDMSNDSMLFEQKAPSAQAGVDYLAEAEVYLRYGMDDEALQQMHLAIEQRPDNLEAHQKLVSFLQSRGDDAAVTAAIEAARSALRGADLEALENSMPASQADDVDVLADESGDDIDFDDVLARAEESTEEPAQAGSEDEGSADDMSIDLGDMVSGTQIAASAGSADDAGLDFTGLSAQDGSDEEPAESAGTEDVAVPGGLDDEGDLDFVSSIEISEADEVEAEDDADADVAAADDGSGLDFSLDDESQDDSELGDMLQSLSGEDAAEEDDTGLAFDSPEDAAEEDTALSSEVASLDDDELGLDEILGEFAKDADGESSDGIDFASAGSGVTTYEQNADDEIVPETVIDSGSDDELGIDAILGEFAMHEAEGSDEAADEGSVPETVIEADATEDDDLGLDDILGQLDSYSADAGEGATGADSDVVASTSDAIADMPEMDVSDELDDLLAEWGQEGEGLDFEAGPESLDLDRARSLLAENQLDDAEAALTSALAGDRRGDALIGLAEVAAKRGDSARSSELLAEAEDLLDDSNRDWFDSVRNLSA